MTFKKRLGRSENEFSGCGRAQDRIPAGGSSEGARLTEKERQEGSARGHENSPVGLMDTIQEHSDMKPTEDLGRERV